MSETRRSRIVAGGVVGVLWLAMFVLPSACIIAAGQPRWLALAVGVVAFPLAPIGWHGFSEWRRRKREATKSTLTSWDRLLLRTVAVAVLAIGGTLFIARGATWSAVRHHALWFTDWSDPDPIADSPLLRRVPADAEYVIWIRRGESKGLLPLGLSGEVEMVIAVGGGDTIVMLAGEPAVLDQIEPLARLGVNGKDLVVVDGPKGTRILATPKYRTPIKTGTSPLLDLLRKAPSNASMIGAGRGGFIEKAKMKWGVAWARVGESVELGAEAEAIDVAAAEKAIEQVQRQFEKLATSKDCGNQAFANATERDIKRDGLIIRGSAKLSLDAAREIPRCMAGQ